MAPQDLVVRRRSSRQCDVGVGHVCDPQRTPVVGPLAAVAGDQRADGVQDPPRLGRSIQARRTDNVPAARPSGVIFRVHPARVSSVRTLRTRLIPAAWASSKLLSVSLLVSKAS